MRFISEYLPGNIDQQEIESDVGTYQHGDMSTFAVTLPTGNFTLKPNSSYDVMDNSPFIVPPKSLNGHSDQYVFDINMNSFNDIIFPNRNIQYRSSWDHVVKEASVKANGVADTTRSSSVDVGIKQTETTESRQTTVEVKVTSHADDVIKRTTHISGENVEKTAIEKNGSPIDIVDIVTKESNDVNDIVENDAEPEPEIRPTCNGSKPDADVKDNAVLNLIDTMVNIQHNYNHLKSNWDHVGNAISQSLNYLPIPSVLTRMLGFSDGESKGLDRKIPGASPRTYLPHGACKHCAIKRAKQAAMKENNGGITKTNVSKTEVQTAAEWQLLKTNGQCSIALEKSKDSVANNLEMKQDTCCSNVCLDETYTSKVEDKRFEQKPRHLSKMSRDCASINRMLLGVVKDNMRKKQTPESPSTCSS